MNTWLIKFVCFPFETYNYQSKIQSKIKGAIQQLSCHHTLSKDLTKISFKNIYLVMQLYIHSVTN